MICVLLFAAEVRTRQGDENDWGPYTVMRIHTLVVYTLKLLIDWCRGRESNPHVLANNGF